MAVAFAADVVVVVVDAWFVMVDRIELVLLPLVLLLLLPLVFRLVVVLLATDVACWSDASANELVFTMLKFTFSKLVTGGSSTLHDIFLVSLVA